MIMDIKNGMIRLNGEKLPGIIEKISVSCKVVSENKENINNSGSSKVITGWEDQSLSVDLTLIDEYDYSAGYPVIKSSMFDELKALNSVFKKSVNGIPLIYEIAHEYADAVDLKTVLFTDFSHTLGNNRISCSLSFTEHNPRVSSVQSKQPVKKNAGNSTPVTKKAEDLIDPKTKSGLKNMEKSNGNGGRK
jgi:hypothetical protein